MYKCFFVTFCHFNYLCFVSKTLKKLNINVINIINTFTVTFDQFIA